jgi:hypothetical protein
MAAVDDVDGRPGATRLDLTAAGPDRQTSRLHPRQLARVPVMVLGLAALVLALAGGLARLGWRVPVGAPPVAFHGPLMVAGFLGTVIGLERAVALGRVWAYAAPLATGLGALALAGGATGGPGLMTLGSAVMVLVFARILAPQRALFSVVMALGAVAWLAGQVLWLAGAPIHRVVFWWAGFLVLTIAGERLELTRLLRLGPASRAAIVAAIIVLLAGLVLASVAPDEGVPVIGVALLALAVWLGVFDIARQTARGSGLTRFIAVALLAGYAWLGIAGLLALRWGAVAAGPQYDAMVHAIFLGFVFSLIFGHAPIIFPAVLGIGVAYRPAFYAHLGLLHGSLVLRVVGDLAAWAPGRSWGGLLNALAIVVFFANTGYGALDWRRSRAAPVRR